MSELGWGRPHPSSDSDCNPSRNSFFLSGASRRAPPRLATPGKKGLGTPTSDRHPRALKGVGCGLTSITHAPESAVFAYPAAKLMAHISVLADTPAIGADLSIQTLVRTSLLVHARYVTARAISILHAGCRI